MKKIIIVLGTRPEAIKLALLVHALKAMPDDISTVRNELTQVPGHTRGNC